MMRTLRTLMRASAAEAEEGLVASQATRLLAQHLRDADADVKRARHGVAALVAKQKAEARRREAAAAEIERREGEARDALARGADDLAADLAGRIADLEEEIERARKTEADLAQRVEKLRTMTAEAERRMARIAADLRRARAGRLARSIRSDLAEGGAPAASALDQAEALAAEMNERGRTADDTADALEQRPMTASDDLDSRVADAGLAIARNARRDAIMARLKGGGPTPTDGPTDNTTTDSKGDAR